jgi:hypothetical protein
MSFESDWKNAKKTFEAATGKKKPSEGFLGAIRKSTGVASACKELDKSLEKPTAASLLKAQKDYDSAADNYIKVLQNAAKADKATDTYKAEIKKLEDALEKIREEFAKDKQTALQTMPLPFEEIIPDDILKGLIGSHFTSKPGVKKFATDSEIALYGPDGKTKFKEAADAQKLAQQALKDYDKAKKDLEGLKKKVMERKEAFKKAYDIFGDASNAVGTNGFQKALAEWKHFQGLGFQQAKKKDEFSDWFLKGPVSKILAQAGKEADEEVFRLNSFEEKLHGHLSGG